MDAEKNTKKQVLFYVLLAALVAAVVLAIVKSSQNASIKEELKVLEAEKEMQRADFQAEVDSLMKVHNELNLFPHQEPKGIIQQCFNTLQ